MSHVHRRRTATAEDVVPARSREAVLRRLLDGRQVLHSGASAQVDVLGTVHRSLAPALEASRRALASGDGSWLELRERISLQALTSVAAERASRIRFLSHQWSNQLHALSEVTHDEDLAQLAEDFYIDSRIMLATDVQHATAGVDAQTQVLDAPSSPERMLGQLMFDCYRLGGWPCGWEGAFPQGRLQIFAR
jgi:hypothetical protein